MKKNEYKHEVDKFLDACYVKNLAWNPGLIHDACVLLEASLEILDKKRRKK